MLFDIKLKHCYTKKYHRVVLSNLLIEIEVTVHKMTSWQKLVTSLPWCTWQ